MMRTTLRSISMARLPLSNFLTLLNSALIGTYLNSLILINYRKRMTVIVKTPDGKIKVMCKGADSII